MAPQVMLSLSLIESMFAHQEKTVSWKVKISLRDKLRGNTELVVFCHQKVFTEMLIWLVSANSGKSQKSEHQNSTVEHNIDTRLWD